MYQVPGRRLTDKFRRNNHAHGFKYTPGGKLPPRRTSAATSALAPSSPELSTSATLPSSPPRKIVSDFKAFGASSSTPGGPGLSVFGAPMLPTGPGGGMFGAAGRTPTLNASMRAMRGGEDDDDDDDDDMQLKREAISLDQARRIATQSVFRAGRLPL